jgi:hypothetical protein
MRCCIEVRNKRHQTPFDVRMSTETGLAAALLPAVRLGTPRSQTKANADGMDHAVRDDLAAIVIPREPCRPLVIYRHPCNHEDQSPISAVVGFAVASNEDTR